MTTPITERLDAMRAFYAEGHTRELAFRKKYLRRLLEAVKAREAETAEALYADLHKSREEAYISETAIVLAEIRDQLRHLERRARSRRVPTPPFLFPSASRIIREPKGVVLVMAPWNYPFQLALDPLAGAIAAGNCVVLKPSATSAHTRRLLADIVGEVFPPEYVWVFEGDHAATDRLLDCRFDHIFFTGGATFGRTVMEKAAAHLTPVTLELGGKSPCIVDRTADLDTAARKIVWGKLLNAGQTCIAPDYLFVHSEVKEALLEKIKTCTVRLYGRELRSSDAYPRIVSDRAFARLRGYIDTAERIVWGGEYDAADRFIAPTLIDAPDPDSPLMREEIFGPILPVLEFTDPDTVADFVNARAKPLALYYFGRKADGFRLLGRTSSGGACINDTVVHIAASRLPFGGVGASGMGRYHGRFSFDTFSNLRGTLLSPRRFDLPLRYPPYGRSFGLLKKLL